VKIGYLDCFSGVSGDMCLGALVDAGVPVATIREALGTLPLSGYTISARRADRHGLACTQVDVTLAEHEHHPHRGLSDVLAIVEGGDLPGAVVEDASRVFRRLAEAEARVHGTDVERIHFHEVGAVDAICDVVGTAVGLHALGLDGLMFSPVALGGGTIQCAHGLLPVPAPATAELLKGVPTVGGPVDVELATPTGAAILTALGEPAPTWPQMVVEAVGYGAGGRDLEGVPNVLRLIVGSTGSGSGLEAGCVWVLETNLDDMTPEQIGHCTSVLLKAGALDVFGTPVQMKKGRPGVLLTVLCAPDRLATIERALFRHTSTFGVRRTLWQRSKLHRTVRTVQTPWGEVRLKVGRLDEDIVRCEPEYEDCKRIAEAHDVPLRDVYRLALRLAGSTADD